MNKLHIDTLLLLRSASQYGQTLAVLLDDLRERRHRQLAVPELERAVRELADRSLVSTFESPLSGTRWRITALGTDTLKEEGL